MEKIGAKRGVVLQSIKDVLQVREQGSFLPIKSMQSGHRLHAALPHFHRHS